MRTIALGLMCHVLLWGSLEARIIEVPEQYPTIQEGINAAIDGDTVLVAPGTYNGPGNRDIDFYGKAIHVASEAGPDSTIIEGPYHIYAFHFHNNENHTSLLNGFTIRFFFTAIVIEEASPSIMNCRFITNGYFLFSAGGGIFMNHSSAFIQDCVFAYNQAYEGSSIYYLNSAPSIEGCVFFENYVHEYCSGIYSAGAETMPYVNCTFYSNYRWAIYGGSPLLVNCILWANDYAIWSDADVTYSDIQGGWPGEGNIDTDPLVVDPENGDFHLSPESPCIDAGDPDSPNIRWGGFRRDMGALEYDQGFYFDGQNIILKPFPMEISWLR